MHETISFIVHVKTSILCTFLFAFFVHILSSAKAMGFVLIVQLSCIFAFVTLNFNLSSTLSQLVLGPQMSKMRDQPPMDVIDIKLWILVKKCFAKIHEILGTYAFSFTNIEVKAKVLAHEEIQLVLFGFQLTKFVENVLEIHHLVFGDLF